jgi:hypothetical protein
VASEITEIMAQVHEAGAKLTVRDGQLGIAGKVPGSLRAQVIEHRQQLVHMLTFDQEEAMRLFREALSYLAEHYVPGAECEKDGELSERIDRAIEQQDMWAFKVTRKEWVNAWLRAIGEAKVELSQERQGVA